MTSLQFELASLNADMQNGNGLRAFCCEGIAYRSSLTQP